MKIFLTLCAMMPLFSLAMSDDDDILGAKKGLSAFSIENSGNGCDDDDDETEESVEEYCAIAKKNIQQALWGMTFRASADRFYLIDAKSDEKILDSEHDLKIEFPRQCSFLIIEFLPVKPIKFETTQVLFSKSNQFARRLALSYVVECSTEDFEPQIRVDLTSVSAEVFITEKLLEWAKIDGTAMAERSNLFFKPLKVNTNNKEFSSDETVEIFELKSTDPDYQDIKFLPHKDDITSRKI